MKITGGQESFLNVRLWKTAPVTQSSNISGVVSVASLLERAQNVVFPLRQNSYFTLNMSAGGGT